MAMLPESSVVSAHVLGSLLLPLFSMNLPIQKKNMAALVTSTLHLPQANPKNEIPYTKLNSITENRKETKKKQRFQRKVGGLIVAGSFFLLFFGFCVCLVVWLIVPPVYRGGFTLKMFSLSHTLSLGLLCVLKATSQRDAAYFWKEYCV